MKIRQGFVSNSSSSCFMLGTETGYTAEALYSELEKMYVKLNSICFNRKEAKILRKQFRNTLHVLEINKKNRQHVHTFIDTHTCGDFKPSELKDGLCVISHSDNSIPHELLYAIEDKFGVEWVQLS